MHLVMACALRLPSMANPQKRLGSTRFHFLGLLSVVGSSMADDLTGLQGAAAAIAGAPDAAEGPQEKRRKLRHYDLLPSQLLNPMGMSGIESVELRRLFVTMSRGNKQCAAFSELCFPEPERRGVALSRLSQVMVASIERLRDCAPLRDIIKEDMYGLIMDEANRLYPYFKALHRGNNSSEESASLRSIAYSVVPAVSDDPDYAAQQVWQWLRLAQSPLRSALAILSSGGLFYVAQCHEKGARAAVDSVPIDCNAFRQAATTRAQVTIDASANELAGLSQPSIQE